MLGFCAPAGDQTPRPQLRRKSEQRMHEFRGLTYSQEIGRRVANAFEDVAGVIAKDIRTDVPLVHRVQPMELPARIVTEAECAVAKKVCEDIDAKQTPAKSDYWTRDFYRSVAERYEAQQKGEGKTYEMELHVLRLGDVAIATNPFELFLDYGVQIEARSPAVQTFLIQLAAAGRQHAYYLPTPRAMAGGALDDKPFTNYSAHGHEQHGRPGRRTGAGRPHGRGDPGTVEEELAPTRRPAGPDRSGECMARRVAQSDAPHLDPAGSLALGALGRGAGADRGGRVAVQPTALRRGDHELFPPDDPVLLAYQDGLRLFGGAELVVVAYTDPDLLTADGLRHLHEICGDLP